MKKIPLFLAFLVIQLFFCQQSKSQNNSDRTLVTLQIDGTKKFQQIDGFGVNINTAWWYEGEYGDARVVQPAIDKLIDSLGATIFRAVIEEIDWEAVNDDNDPNNFNWTYYNSIFSNARFQGMWNTLRYLNKKGITDGLVISFMGGPPASPPMSVPDLKRNWMGGADYSIATTMEDELVESIAALLYYMRKTAAIQFKLVSPMNETDVIAMSKGAEHPDGIVEGPNIPDAVQYIRIVKKLSEKLDAIGMGDIRFVAPDAGGDRLFGRCLEEMVKDPYLMSKLAHWGVHQYGNDAANFLKIVSQPGNPNKSYWITETAGIGNLLGQLDDNAGAYIFWDGFDCVYQHGRRNGYGSVPPNDWVFWFGPEEGKPLIGYVGSENTWKPRKQFYQFSQVMKFVMPGAVRIEIEGNDSNLVTSAFINPDGNIVIAGRNNNKQVCTVVGTFSNNQELKNLKLIYTDSSHNLIEGSNISVSDESFKATIPPESVFTITGRTDSGREIVKAAGPEPNDWYAGDMHIHRNCGEGTSIMPDSEFISMMEPNDLAVISVLADMGDGEVKDSKTDLPKVNGTDAVQSMPGRTVHWDAEWHFDPAGTTFENKALGGHIVLLGLSEAHTIWDESPYKILEYGRSQNAIVGFCHMQYLKDSIPATLDCCTPIDFPVEAALGTIDFLAEDVWLNDAAVNAYYKILNCGFRLGWAAGTDFPCNNSQPFGSLLTYVQVKDQPMTYRKWVEGIKNGRTVVTTNGHVEFLDFKVNGAASPGDEIKLKKKGNIKPEVIWTSTKELTGRIEFICNGKVIATKKGTSRPGKPVHFKTEFLITESSWICARRMDATGHRSHTAPVYITVKDKPVRASEEDAKFFINWIDNILENIAPGKPWDQYFTHDLDVVVKRYEKARDVYKTIAGECSKKIMGCSKHNPVAPILILTSNTGFGTYTGEILKAEGFNEFNMDSLTSQKVNESYLKQFDLIILAESKVNQAEKEVLSEFVKKGGNLIAFRPDPSVAELFGITPAGGKVADGYITIDTASDIGRRLNGKPLQIHGIADIYTVKEGNTIATLISGRQSTDLSPAVVTNNYGKGHSVAFLYDLPKSIVLTRQGNPMFAGVEKDGIFGLRPMDLFTDGWVDTSKNTINQADEQMGLLMHCIENLNKYTKPVPRFWYFPDTLKCLATLTNDGENSTEAEFEPQFADVDAKGAKMTLYVLEPEKISREWVARWINKGHEISGHPDNVKHAGDPDWNTMDRAIKLKLQELNDQYGITEMHTTTNHWFVWCGKNEEDTRDFAAQAKLEEKNGIGLDCNYAHYDNGSSQGHFLGSFGFNQGNYTGSGLVMKFADANGRMVDVYQQLNNVYDQQYMEHDDQVGFFNCFKGLMDRSLNNEVYSYICIRAHNNEYCFSKVPLMNMLDYANSKGIPIWTERKLLDFIKMREEASITNTAWSHNKLSFDLSSSLTHSNDLTVMVSNDFGNKTIKGILKNCNESSFIVREVKGSAYAFLTVEPGADYSIIVTYGE